jgi:hypothetical protein
MTAIDLNNDNFLDLVILHDNSKDFTVLINSGTGTFLQPKINYALTDANAFYKSIIAADMNGDGYNDLLITRHANAPNGIYLVFNKGDASFQIPTSYPFTGLHGQNGRGFVLGDVNGDGHLDVVLSTGSSMYIFQGTADGIFHIPTKLQIRHPMYRNYPMFLCFLLWLPMTLSLRRLLKICAFQTPLPLASLLLGRRQEITGLKEKRPPMISAMPLRSFTLWPMFPRP